MTTIDPRYARQREDKVFHLGWHRRHIADCERRLVYVLVPRWLGAFEGSLKFEAISSEGRPLDVKATVNDLASPRKDDDTEGVGHPLEIRLIEALSSRAQAAQHFLPQLAPTLRFPNWSRLILTEDVRCRLLKAGGVP